MNSSLGGRFDLGLRKRENLDLEHAKNPNYAFRSKRNHGIRFGRVYQALFSPAFG